MKDKVVIYPTDSDKVIDMLGVSDDRQEKMIDISTDETFKVLIGEQNAAELLKVFSEKAENINEFAFFCFCAGVALSPGDQNAE